MAGRAVLAHAISAAALVADVALVMVVGVSVIFSGLGDQAPMSDGAALSAVLVAFVGASLVGGAGILVARRLLGKPRATWWLLLAPGLPALYLMRMAGDLVNR